jgi:nucleoid-associated protein YgaU
VVNKLNLKSILKSLKLNEGNISMFLGALIILITGFYVVRYFRNLDTQNTLPEPGMIEEKEIGTTGGNYTIQKGDTLWKIAERQYGDGFQWTKIAQANNLEDPSALEEGQTLVVPGLDKEAGVSQVAANPISGATYQVEKGDSLWEIAVRAYGDGFQWTKIAEENSLDNPDIIHYGNILTLPR